MRFFFSLALLAAAPLSPVETVEALRDADLQVATIGYRLATANAARCDRRTPATGLLVHSIEQYEGPYRAAAAKAFALGDAPEALAVLPGSPAAAAGIAPSDAILAIDGIATPPRSGEGYARTGAVLDRLDAALADGPARLKLDAREVVLEGKPACASRFQVKVDGKLNAGADGKTVEITTGFMAKAANDDEIAALLAHELAHNILKHRERLDAAGVKRGLLGKFGKNAARIRETEIEADRLSIRLLAAAGYRVEAAPAFWRRFGPRHNYGIFADATHLGWKRRVALLEAEIAALLRGG